MSAQCWEYLPDGRWSLKDVPTDLGVALLVKGQKLWFGRVILGGHIVEFDAPTLEEAKFKAELLV